MLARLQRTIVLALILFAIAWAAVASAAGHPRWSLGGLAVIVTLYVAVMGIEFAWMARVNHRSAMGQGGPSAAALWSAFWNEVTTAPRVFCWQQPFRSTVHPDRLDAEPDVRGVVLVHGFVCNRGLWNRWLARYTAARVPFVAVNLEPVFGSIDAVVPAIDAAVNALQHRTGRAPVVVAHSMGGLAVRAWARAQGEGAWARVHHVVTLGTPHAGTALAALAFSRNGRQMRRGSPWLTQLTRDEAGDIGRHFTCLYSDCDNIVFPARTAWLDHSHAMAVTGWAHVHLVDHPAAFEAVEAARTSRPD